MSATLRFIGTLASDGVIYVEIERDDEDGMTTSISQSSFTIEFAKWGELVELGKVPIVEVETESR